MHPHFYHWHNLVDLKPETDILKVRWDAAETFAHELTANNACSLLRLALFGVVDTEFATLFSEALVTQEPTFPPEKNLELLRVMATAALHSQMKTRSAEADAVALGLHVAAFQPSRTRPVCKELAQRAAEYLGEESERMRPTPKISGDFKALKDATEEDSWEENPEVSKLIGKAVLELGATMGRIAEENQYMWWLLGRRSSLLNKRREQLLPKEYALVAGMEAAGRVALLPPPASVESLIEEVLTHCSKSPNLTIPLVDYLQAADFEGPPTPLTYAHELCPISGLLEIRRTTGSINNTSLEKFALPAKLKISPSEAAIQYFRELMFFKALIPLH